MRLTVLGSSASYPGPGQACSGYLLESGGARVMLDCGNGTVANAGRVMDVTMLDAVMISHEHADHFADLYALQAALRFAPQGPVGRLPLHLPEGLFERVGCALSEHGRVRLAEAFDASPLVDGAGIVIGPMTFTPHAVHHEGPTFAFAVDDGGGRLGYTADTRYGDDVRAAMHGCDVLLAECTLPTEYAGRAAHLSPAEAGRLATESGARTLVLTHLWPTSDRERLRTDAAGAFGGEILIASELMTVDVRSRASEAKREEHP